MADVKTVRGFVAFRDGKRINNDTGTAFTFEDEATGKFIDVVFWDNRFPDVGDVTAGDYVIMKGVGDRGSYQTKDGDTKPTFKFTPFSVVKLDGHQMVKGEGGSNAAPAEEDDPF